MGDAFQTVAQSARTEIKVRGSRFIAEVFPVFAEEEAECEVASIREREHRATHHCSAYRIGAEGDLYRYNDDGEPSGTAGRPILRQIDGRGLTNTLVVVTRYFGGTKLGTGGLARAYGGAAAEALDAAGTTTRVLRETLHLRFAYDDTAPARRVIERFEAQVIGERYAEDTELTVAVRRSEADAFRTAFANALAGRGSIEKGGE